MTGPDAIDALLSEHATMRRVLDAVLSETSLLEAEGAIDARFWADVLTFIEGFIIERHGRSEEQVLFPELVLSGVRGTTLAVFRSEHADNRALAGTLRAACAAADPLRIARAARDYVAAMCEHMSREQDVLFPLARAMLEQAALARAGERLARLRPHPAEDPLAETAATIARAAAGRRR